MRVTSIDASLDGKLIACGSDSGAVNLYRIADVLGSERPAPQKEFLNLTSAITHVRFNPTSAPPPWPPPTSHSSPVLTFITGLLSRPAAHGHTRVAP